MQMADIVKAMRETLVDTTAEHSVARRLAADVVSLLALGARACVCARVLVTDALVD